MCVAIKFVVRVAAVWALLNALTMGVVLVWKRFEHPMVHPDGEMHTWVVDKDTYVLADIMGLACFIIAVWSCLMLTLGMVWLYRYRDTVIDDEERRPLLKA